MKKLIIIFLLANCCSLFLFPQDNKQIKKEKQRFCSAKVLRIDKKVNEFILFGFKSDSIWGYGFSKQSNKKTIITDSLIYIKSTDIRRIYIQKEKHVSIQKAATSADSLDLRDFNDYLTSINIMNISSSLLTESFHPAANLFLLGVSLLFPAKGKWYYIRGKDIRFNKMVKELKPKTNSTSK